MNKRTGILILSMFLGACSQGLSGSSQTVFEMPKVKQGPVVVTVNNTQIHQGLLDVLGELNPRIKAQLSNPMTRKKILGSLVEQQLLYQEAVKKGLQSKDDVVLKHLLNKHVIVSNALVESELEAAMKKAYDERKTNDFTKVDVSVIGVHFDVQKAAKDDAGKKAAALKEIKALKAKLDKGEDFAKLAKEKSHDKTTARKGGQAGKISKTDKRFERRGLQKVTEAAFKLKKDQHSDPIETTKGYYIVKVTSEPAVIAFEDAKRSLSFELQNKVKSELIEKLKKSAKIAYADTEEKKPKPEAQPKAKK